VASSKNVSFWAGAENARSAHTDVMLPRLPVKIHAHIVNATLVFAALALLPEASSAATLREKWQAEERGFRTLSGSICDGCDSRPAASRRSPKSYSALVDPIAVLERSSRTTARYLASASPTARLLSTPIVDRTLASTNQRISRRYARILAHRRLAKLIRARRYAAVIARRKSQAAANAAAAKYKVDFGRIEQQTQ
jgi:hypothetical protein